MSKAKPELKELQLSDIIVSKTNPRKHFDEESINELAQSIKEKGVLQPVVVRLNGKPGKYELVCGERRYRASKVAEQKTIPAVIRELTDEEALELQIIENLQRKDVHPMEEAVAFNGLMVMKKMEVKDIALRVAKSPTYVAQRLKLNDLIEDFQKAFYQERMTIGTAVTIAKLRPEDQQELWENNYEDSNCKIDPSSWQLKRYYNDLTDAPFDKADPTLNKKMGGCGGCQFNSASNTLLFPDSANNATCLNGECFKIKCDAFFIKELKEAKSNPEVVLVSTEYNMGKEGKDLVAKGETIYGYNSFTRIYKPERPDINDNAYDIDDYDSEEERMESFNSDVKIYENELADYEKKISSGKYIKAFVVEGNDKGHYTYIAWSKDRNTAKPAATANLKAKEENGTVTAEDIKAEIDRVKATEKRKKELDEEKVHAAASEAFLKEKLYDKNDEPLGVEEFRGAILSVAVSDYHIGNDVCKFIGANNGYDLNVTLFKKLATKKHAELEKILAFTLRAAMLKELTPTKGAPNQRPSANGRCAAFADIMKVVIPVKYAEIERAQTEEALKRENKVEERLKKLNAQLKQLAPTTKTKKAK